jgi:CRP-like cAMP-binding protein
VDEARLGSIPLFASLSKDERRQVARWADEIDLPAGKVIVAEGRLGYEFFAIEEGTAEVTQEGKHLRNLGPGDFFGEIALIETERRTATVAATSPMLLIVMTRQNFQHMARDLPEVAAKIAQAIRERLPGA